QDVLLSAIDCAFEIFGIEIALVRSARCPDRSGVSTGRGPFVLRNGDQWKLSGLREFTRDFINRFHRPGVNFLYLAIFQECVQYDFQAAQAMIENQDSAWNHQERFRQPKFVLRGERNFGFEKVDRLVTNEPDGATAKARQVRTRYKLITGHHLLYLIDW